MQLEDEGDKWTEDDIDNKVQKERERLNKQLQAREEARKKKPPQNNNDGAARKRPENENRGYVTAQGPPTRGRDNSRSHDGPRGYGHRDNNDRGGVSALPLLAKVTTLQFDLASFGFGCSATPSTITTVDHDTR